jgi:PfaD family protein
MAGIHRDVQGRIATPNRVMAKVSRVEVAERFFAPPPGEMLGELVRRGELTPEQAELASQVPVAQDVTAEADSGGHTDNRSPFALYPLMFALRDRLQRDHGYAGPLRVGAAGGIATPHAAAAAFTMGAAYVLTGSVNQACREAGTSDAVRELLAAAGQGDQRMAPAADMFEMGGKLQVLTRGTMFAMRAQKLYEIYSSCARLEDIPPEQRLMLERTIFRAPLEEIWRQTRAFWTARDVSQVERAERDPKHMMALVFRWYLGQTSRWANRGEAGREIDYQIWCGPAMAAFNEWVRGSWLEPWRNRRVVPVALNILRGAAVLMHAAAIRGSGGVVDAYGLDVTPLESAELEEYFA